MFDFCPNKSCYIDHNLEIKTSDKNNSNLNLTANSTGFGGGPRLSLASSSIPGTIFPKSIRRETTKSRTKKKKPN